MKRALLESEVTIEGVYFPMVDTVRFSMGSTVSFIAGKLSFWVLMVLGSRRCFESWQESLNRLLDG